jgi:hypothetical protein
MDSSSADAVSQLTGPISTPRNPREIAICVHHSGRCFRTTFDLASAFIRRAHALTDQGGAELVPLLHESGIELLFVSSQTPLQVHDIRDHSFDESHPPTK